MFTRCSILACLLYSLSPSAGVFAQDLASYEIQEVVVTARLREERLQDIPAAVSVLDGTWLDSARAVNTKELSTLVPSLYFNSANPRNTAYTIRGLGSNTLSISAANDGMEPGVGFYIDGVYHGRPATAAFDFTDIDRVEVLRGPQGTLFGKNTTGGAINILSRIPSFDPQSTIELSRGNHALQQVRANINGPLLRHLAGRFSLLTTRRDGVIHNSGTGEKLNSLDNYAWRGQLLFDSGRGFTARLIADVSSLDSSCCTQTFLRVGESLRDPHRQFPALAAGLGYEPPSRDIYTRLSDIDAELYTDTEDGGVSLHLSKSLGAYSLELISAWRYWDWNVANDRDYIGVPIQVVQRIPSRQDQYSHELRLTSTADRAFRYVAGLYYFHQEINGHPTSIYGPEAAYWLLDTDRFDAEIPRNLLDGYGQTGDSNFAMQSYAVFGEFNYDFSPALTATVGMRYTLEDKQGSYSTRVFGGLETATNPDAAELERAKRSIFSPQAYAVHNQAGNVSGRANIAYRVSANQLLYLSYSRGYKSGGLNMSGLPRDAQSQPVLTTALIDDELNSTWEVGMKHNWLHGRGTVNLAAFSTTVQDYQTNVVSSIETAALRSYPANIPQVKIRGLEADLMASPFPGFLLRASLAYANGEYADYPQGPCPLEAQTATTAACDLTGLPLPGLSTLVGSLGADWSPPSLSGLVMHADITARSGYNSNNAVSRYTEIGGHGIVNASIGYQFSRSWMMEVFARNLFDRNYLTALTLQSGNSGLVLGQASDPRIVGISLRMTLE